MKPILVLLAVFITLAPVDVRAERVGLQPMARTPTTPDGVEAGLILPHDRPPTAFVIHLVHTIPENVVATPAGSLVTPLAQHDIATAYIKPGELGEDLHLGDRSLASADSVVYRILGDHSLAPDRFILIGGSLSGGAAVRFAEYCLSESQHGLRPAGVLAWDPVLDYARMWQEQRNALRERHHQDAVNEARAMIPLLERIFGGTPDTNPDGYARLSPFSFASANGGHAEALRDTPVRLVTELDTYWWIQNRGKDLDDINAIDCIAMIAALRGLGNRDARLVLTSGRGYRADGTRHPHAWSIVDTPQTVRWILACLNRE